MLGTRIILLGMAGVPSGAGAQPNAEMICAANHAIPLFWLLLFSTDELERFVVGESDEVFLTHVKGSTYPILVAERSCIQVRLELRYQQLKGLISQEDDALLQRWIAFITALNYPVLAIDTYELWSSMAEPDSLYDEIAAMLRGFEALTMEDADVQLQHWIDDKRWPVNNSIALAGFGW